MTDEVRAALAARLTVSRAQSAARAGDLDKAAGLLTGLDPAAVTEATLDLLARVHAQRGDLGEADECWARVQALTPDHPAAAAGRRVIREITEGRRRATPLLHTGRLAAAMAALGVLAAGGLAWTAIDTTDPAAPSVDLAARLRAETRRSDNLEERVSTMESERRAQDTDTAEARSHLNDTLAAIADALAMPGVSVSVHDSDVRVLFEQGLFSRGTDITAEGTALLGELGRRLATMDVLTTVVGHAAAVPGGRTTGGSTVALARAQLAANHLADSGGLPLTAFTLTSADQTQNPFPDQARNRTVSFLITPTKLTTPK
ncbi:hypothetical protein [Actinophytocola oryzae]|uniref:OmpA family protein n=1 Tax=Actinophytocola oryzae TaxID=502181 RepID=A0A4R7UPY2_9PSEU|nr:hypothetical protein [Actinophytocola oryzae]TDV35434.1 hypothetical protein CLV71_13421 [Actinophytocola oryzae]